jgi:CheY-like chemotaxis protein
MTELESQRRILVVDNDPQVIQSVPFNLRMAGYMVLTANNVEGALNLIRREIIHLAIIDIRLRDEEEEEYSGFDVARQLPKYIPCIIYTAYEDKPNIKMALQQVGAKDIIDKRDLHAAEHLIAAVHNLFATEVKLNFNLEIQGTLDFATLARSIRVPALTGLSNPTADDVENVLRRLFYSANKVQISFLLQPEVAPTPSQSGAVLIAARPRFEHGWAMPMVVKFSDKEEIEHEAQNYDLIEPFLGWKRRPEMRGAAYSRRIGGLIYSFIDTGNLNEIRTFDDIFLHESTERIVELLRQFFSQTFRDLFQNAERRSLNLTELYTGALRLTYEKLREAVASFHPEALNEPQLRFKALRGVHLNPLTWIVRDGKFRHLEVISRYCLCHGDLHGRNILVDSNDRFWLIDFARVAPSHALRDFAELETDIKYYLLPEADLQMLLAFEQALLAPRTFQDAPPLGIFTNENLAKAYRVVLGLRQIAADLLDLDGDMREYYQALLFHTLTVLRLGHISNTKKEHALLAASLICQRIDIWPAPLGDMPLAPLGTSALPKGRSTPALPQAPAQPSLWSRVLAAGSFMLVGAVIILIFFAAMSYFNPSWQQQLMTVVLMAVLIIAALGLVGLVSGATVVAALQELVGHLLGGGKPNQPNNQGGNAP